MMAKVNTFSFYPNLFFLNAGQIHEIVRLLAVTAFRKVYFRIR